MSAALYAGISEIYVPFDFINVTRLSKLITGGSFSQVTQNMYICMCVCQPQPMVKVFYCGTQRTNFLYTQFFSRWA